MGRLSVIIGRRNECYDGGNDSIDGSFAWKESPASVPRTDSDANDEPQLVSKNDVKRVSGSSPRVAANDELPKRASAKLCIDDSGRVETVSLETPVDKRAEKKIVDQLSKWQVAPYEQAGVARPVCFKWTFEIKQRSED